ncbi:MAG: undecaprenyldiphospho-muramoylpentapeptide beta-N-acetylglucosaminyltransferase [Bacteroidetes bacterium]|nr:undecaprenyldiphospho-muramoylpentapeptide beta-N-acetylglucosaminyltransferase [Bacteroidota bacterium]
MPHKFILSGGGTGGHIFPALAIAEALKKQLGPCDIHFVGAVGRMEMEKVPAAGYPITGLPIRGLQRRLSLSNLGVPFAFMKSLRLAKQLLRDFQPDAVIGTGGYASAAVLYAATSRHIPTLIWEGNGYAGLTNRWLGKKVDRICTGFAGMESYFPAEKIVYTGNPVRRDLLSLPDKRAARMAFGLNPEQPVCLIIGGSLGARTLNTALDSGVQQLLQAEIQVIWQTGKNYTSKEQNLPAGLWRDTFIQRMDQAYAAADLVVSRAGALSVSEIAVAGKASILVPSPNVTEDHQTKNALKLSEHGAALLLPDQEAVQSLPKEILRLMKDAQARELMQQAVQKLAIPDAADRIAHEVIQLIQA